jgi:cephalosporin hydroxylase
MADRVVAATDTLNYFRHEFNATAEDVGAIADILSASGIIASATDVVESVLQRIDAYNSQVNAVIGVDIDIRKHNLDAINLHPMRSRMELIEGSSIDNDIISRVHKLAKGYSRIMVFLDSNHTHDHVLSELEAYAKLTSINSYCVVFDTVIEDLPDELSMDRPWNSLDNPKTAVWEFLKSNSDFEIDKEIVDKILLTVAPDGYLKKVK